jgi:hypothetical protein
MQDPQTGYMHKIPDGIANMLKDVGKPPIFTIGEIIELRGGRFRVAAIGKRFIRFEGLPGTHVRRE